MVVIAAWIFEKKKSKLMNFFVAILILKVEGKKQHFLDTLCFTISRKVKTELKHRKKSSIWKRCCDCWMYQKWLAKFHTGDFLLDGKVNVIPRGREPTYSISKTRHWKSFALAWLCQSLWCLGSTQVKQKKSPSWLYLHTGFLT